MHYFALVTGTRGHKHIIFSQWTNNKARDKLLLRPTERYHPLTALNRRAGTGSASDPPLNGKSNQAHSQMLAKYLDARYPLKCELSAERMKCASNLADLHIKKKENDMAAGLE